MKILIISTPRSGSTTLFNGLYKSLNNYKGFCEPFNLNSESKGDSIKEYSLNYSNLLIKVLPWDLLLSNKSEYFGLIDHLFQTNNYSLDMVKSRALLNLKNYSSNFDQIILLTRRNKLLQAQSYSFASLNQLYHTTYKYNQDFQDLARSFTFIKNHDDILLKLSIKLDIPITYYEDLFQGDKNNINNFLTQNNIQVDNINTFYEYLDPKNRYRQS
jgi:hypothetical protein